MRLKERENAAAVKVMRRLAKTAAVPLKGVMVVFREESCGDGCGVQGEGRGRKIAYLTIRGYRYCLAGIVPLCLNPLGSTGKRPVGPERPYGLLTFLISFGWGVLHFLHRPTFGPCPAEERKKNRVVGVKNRGSYQGSEGKKQRRIRA
jgi:hypothetical protein